MDDFGSESTLETTKKRKFCNFLVEGTSENGDFHKQNKAHALTFFSLSIHFIMAGTLDPVRSFKARIASLINKMVPMVYRQEVIFQSLRKVGSQG